MVTRLVLILGDQLNRDVAALRAANMARDIVVMAEVAAETDSVPHHPKKIAFLFAAMRKFAASLTQEGWRVAYTRLDDPENSGSIPGELQRRASEFDADQVIATEPGEFRLIAALNDSTIPVTQHEDDRFLASHADFTQWAAGRKTLRMEYFYREMRRRTGLLMDGDKPVGGKWNFDHENRKPPPESIVRVPLKAAPDAVTDEVLDLVESRFGNRFGAARPFWFATDRAGALAALDDFVTHALPRFGDFQDAISDTHRFLYHAMISGYLNTGLLTPLETCRAAERAWLMGLAPLNAVEGFIRQIIGWREYIRGIYFHEGPNYLSLNALNHHRELPEFYWSGDTDMRCVAQSIAQTRDEAYAHHIQRLMVTGNFGLLAGIKPSALHIWYLAVYWDAFEWVEAPNTLGMSQFADDGVIASKPYVSSGSYIDRMSDSCRACRYKVKDKTGPDACPFNLLYWHFLIRHRSRFEGNPRMGNMYRTWGRMDPSRRALVLAEAENVLARLDAGHRI